jgi:hypothetical protein
MAGIRMIFFIGRLYNWIIVLQQEINLTSIAVHYERYNPWFGITINTYLIIII